jgi:hypothetical protein
MQAVMCLIFCASVGLAQYVIHERRLSGSSRLGVVLHGGPLDVKLPRGWKTVLDKRGSLPLVAIEPDSTDRKGRRLTIRCQKLTTLISSEEYLQASGLLNGTERPEVRADPAANVADPITIAGDPGVVLAVLRPTGGFLGIGATGYEKVLFAASVRPSGLAVSLELQCSEDSDADDDAQTLSDIAAAMSVQDSGTGQ